jgi:cell division septation protein DedD
MRTYEQSEELNRHSDTEITLGMRSILGIFFGLALICGVFFGFGYSLGRGNTGKAAETDSIASNSAKTAHPSAIRTVVEKSNESASDPYSYAGGQTRKPAAADLRSKPSAAAVEQISDATSPASPNAPADGEAQVARASSSPAPVASGPAPGSIQNSTGSSSIMVQIAAVSRRQDADVLVSALNKLGYNASVRGGAGDNLLRVQVGPFATRDEAVAMRTRLLNDGYNAILK